MKKKPKQLFGLLKGRISFPDGMDFYAVKKEMAEEMEQEWEKKWDRRFAENAVYAKRQTSKAEKNKSSRAGGPLNKPTHSHRPEAGA